MRAGSGGSSFSVGLGLTCGIIKYIQPVNAKVETASNGRSWWLDRARSAAKIKFVFIDIRMIWFMLKSSSLKCFRALDKSGHLQGRQCTTQTQAASQLSTFGQWVGT